MLTSVFIYVICKCNSNTGLLYFKIFGSPIETNIISDFFILSVGEILQHTQAGIYIDYLFPWKKERENLRDFHLPQNVFIKLVLICCLFSLFIQKKDIPASLIQW